MPKLILLRLGQTRYHLAHLFHIATATIIKYGLVHEFQIAIQNARLRSLSCSKLRLNPLCRLALPLCAIAHRLRLALGFFELRRHLVIQRQQIGLRQRRNLIPLRIWHAQRHHGFAIANRNASWQLLRFVEILLDQIQRRRIARNERCLAHRRARAHSLNRKRTHGVFLRLRTQTRQTRTHRPLGLDATKHTPRLKRQTNRPTPHIALDLRFRRQRRRYDERIELLAHRRIQIQLRHLRLLHIRRARRKKLLNLIRINPNDIFRFPKKTTI